MIRGKDSSVRGSVLFATIGIVSVGVGIVAAAGGVGIRWTRGYERAPDRVNDRELVLSGLCGRSRDLVHVPWLFLYFKRVGPFSLYVRYLCDAGAYDEVFITSIRLTTADGRELTLCADELPVRRSFRTTSFPGTEPRSYMSYRSKTLLDIRFDETQEVRFVVDMVLRKGWRFTQYRHEGVFVRCEVDEVGSYR